ncbi:ATM interactor [Frankliniella fusca]|uniref:ATM interactor n=1 Tax=Frankliniella fusca TaxID=407009 RepID=A0AAE1H057_9NEOP|nr:ATM interactor [Frankliniella fusca]
MPQSTHPIALQSLGAVLLLLPEAVGALALVEDVEMACMDVCPLASELSVINSNIICPEEGCGKVFKASSALNMHLTKHHRNSCLVKRDSSITVRYFCPEENCIYHVSATRHFAQMKYLKQHYLKVHSEKKFSCDSCNKAFATQELLRYHSQVCGVKFTCSCGNSYSSYEALLTHSKRKQHTFELKYKLGLKRSKSEGTAEVSLKKDTHCFSVDMQPVYILPKPSNDQVGTIALNVLATPNISELSCSVVHDKSMQTDPLEPKRKKTSPNKTSEKALKRRTSAQTQTGGLHRTHHLKKTAETQTMGDYILQKAMEDADIYINNDSEYPCYSTNGPRKRKNNSGTQTAVKKCSKVALKVYEPVLEQSLDAMSLSPCTPFCLKKDVGLPDLWVADKNTSSTQTTGTTDDLLQSTSFSKGDLNLELFGQDGNLCSSNNLQSIFEDNSDSFDNVVGSSSEFGSVPHPEVSMNHLNDLSDENFTSCNVTQTDQNLNHLFLRQTSDDECPASFTTSETQTTDDLNDLDSLLYTNMWTQTSEDPLFSGLDFADTQTQTAWPLYGEETNESVLVSAETQTAISSACPSIIDSECWSCEPSHIETQTCEEDLKDYIAELEQA